MRFPAALCAIAAMTSGAVAQTAARPADRPIHMDAAGVLRWSDTGEEAALFGVNYYAPHVVDYFNLKRLGVSIEETIDRDLAHFVRMGLDLLRLHVFDRELSDAEGNLVANEHLHLLDYLVARARERGLYTVLTPIAWWGSPVGKDGFSNLYTMNEMITDPRARAAQRRYLEQFVSHVNPFTGLAYKDDPAVPAFELINEPLYAAGVTDAQVVEYIDDLADAIRATGCGKPLFYNGWCDRLEAVGAARVDGCSFGWYPSGLVAGRSLHRDFLPMVADYPEMRHPALASKAKMVYEFDAADIPGGYLYPAMARAFRGGGAQLAAQFQYDPLPLAPFNSGWQTHYLNLVYAPQRALGFMVAAEAFRAVPRLAEFGGHPESNRFGPFRVSYEEDLAEMATDRAYLHSNTTATPPPAPERLERIAGCGSSPLVDYDGTGAYFLDRVGPGAWRLEVYPDAVWIADPFGSSYNNIEDEVSRALFLEHPMTLRLPDLGDAPVIAPVTDGAAARPLGPGRFALRLGVYLLRRDAALEVDTAAFERRTGLGWAEFVVPAEERRPPAARIEVARMGVEGKPLDVRVVTASAEPVAGVRLYVRHGAGSFDALDMRRERAHEYVAAIPGEQLRPDAVELAAAVHTASGPWLFPLGHAAEFAPEGPDLGPALCLYDAARAGAPPAPQYSGPASHSAEAERIEMERGRVALRMTATGFPERDGAASVRFARTWIDGGPASLDPAWADRAEIVARARSLYGTTAVELGLIQSDGSAYGYDVPLTSDWTDIRIPVRRLRPLWHTRGGALDPARVESLSLVFGSWLFRDDYAQPHGVELERVEVAPPSPFLRVAVLERDAPVALFDAERHSGVRLQAQVPVRTRVVSGMTPGGIALRLAADYFDEPPSSASLRNENARELDLRRDTLARCDTLRVVARALHERTTGVEVVVLETDGSAWGAVVPLETEWRAVDIPIAQLRLFRHWAGVPAGRGGEGDVLRPEAAAAVSVCFGAWLYGDAYRQPHALEVETIAFVPGP